MADKMAYEGTNTADGPSWSIWGSCPFEAIQRDPRKGIAHHENWQDFPLIGTQTTQIGHGRYKVFVTASGVIAPVSAVNSVEMMNGPLAMNVDTAGDSASIALSYPQILLKSGQGRAWFEGRLALNTIATATLGFIFGLAEVEQFTLATAVPLSDDNALTNAGSFIGFNKLEDGLGAINTCYSDRAAAAPTPIQSSVGSMSAAYDFVNLGLLFDPSNITRAVRFFFDGQECSTAWPLSTLSATTNLDANALGPIFTIQADTSGTSGQAYLKWWRWAQERV